MSVPNFSPTITQAGLNAIANSGGFELKITAIGICDNGGNMSKLATVDNLPVDRNVQPVAGGKNLGNGQWHCTALFFENAEYPVRSVRFYLEDGTLFAYWTHPTNVLFWVTPLNRTVQAFDILMTSVPVGSITIDITGGLNLYYADVFLSQAVVQTQQIQAQMDTNLLLVSMNNKIQQLEA